MCGASVLSAVGDDVDPRPPGSRELERAEDLDVGDIEHRDPKGSLLRIVPVDDLEGSFDRLLTFVCGDQLTLLIWILHFSSADILSNLTISLAFVRLICRYVEK